jgi:hypothetical protein
VSATELARLKLTYPLWSITRPAGVDRPWYLAERAGHLPVTAGTLGELDGKLIEQNRDAHRAAAMRRKAQPWG